jgi:hypothetical protein
LNDALNMPTAVDVTTAGVSVAAALMPPSAAASAAACMAALIELVWL